MKEETPFVVVIDGQGGMIGRKLCDALLDGNPKLNLLALGTNSAATSTMLKGRARQGQPGKIRCWWRPAGRGDRRSASIVVADSMMGEITPKMAAGLVRAKQKRF